MTARFRSSPQKKPLFSTSDISRLFQLVDDIVDREGLTVTEAIQRLQPEPEVAAAPNSAHGIRLGDFVRRLRKIRMKRNEMMGTQMFRDPAWDMMLDLYAAHERSEKVSVSALCYASGVPQSTALRAVQRLEEQGMIERAGDPEDLRRSWVRASSKALAGIEALAAMFAEAVITSAKPPKPTIAEPPYDEFDDLIIPLSA
jgi:DNA-binding MarR family transcriptional regulator